MALSIWRKLIIDRICIIVGIGCDNLYSFAWGQLLELRDLKSDLVPNGTISISKKKYTTRLGYWPVKGRMIANIEVGTTKSKHRYFKLSLFPSKFKSDEFARLQKVVSEFLPGFEYASLFMHGRVAYIEFAADSLTYPAHTFIPFRKRCNHSEIYTDGDGVKGTTYIGSPQSALRYRIYDKRRQLLQKKLQTSDHIRTRIESVSRRLKLAPFELQAKMPNPFVNLRIADLQAARLMSNDIEWHKFLGECLDVGSAMALSKYAKSQRTKFMSRLNAAAAPWWDPAVIWRGMETALLAINPVGITAAINCNESVIH
ncbi:hypothetical protein [Noviherbaspirillum sp.]|uniref:hypothetical protein n=1 Tax=Noviherbaspirillum sp. TaxID=1926288 RepID=UPI002FE4275D